MYTGVNWLEALDGTVAIQEIGTKEGDAGGYYMVPYKLETNSQQQRVEPLGYVLTISQQWG